MKFSDIGRFALRYWYWSVFVVLCLACYASVFISPAFFWPTVFLSYAIPGVLLLNGLLFVAFAIAWRRLVIFPFISLVFGFPFLLDTVTYHAGKAPSKKTISVLSLNAKFFRKEKTYAEFSMDMIKWVVNDSSDIKCIQEFSTNNRWEPLDVNGQIIAKGYHGYTLRSRVQDSDHNPGLGLFTKFDLLDSGVVWQDSTSSNGAIFIDVRTGEDTLRVYNVHLMSMGLAMYEYRNPKYYGNKMKTLVAKLKYGATNRSTQIDRIIEHTKSSPYPFLICGDFNETPYGYNYFKLRSHFANAFETAGRGFGFSVNGGMFFLRIDHHFYSPGLKALNYEVDRSMRISDHYPTRGLYVVEGR